MKKRIVISAFLAIIGLISLMAVTSSKSDLGTVQSYGFSKEVTVTDHVAEPDKMELELDVAQDGDYVFRAEWAPSKEGLTLKW